MRRLLVVVLAMLLCVGLQANVAAQADDDDAGGQSASAQVATKSDAAPEEKESASDQKPAETKSSKDSSKDEPSEPVSDEASEPSEDEASKPESKPSETSAEKPADETKDESNQPDSPTESSAASAAPKGGSDGSGAQSQSNKEDDAFEPYDVVVWWRMARVSDSGVWDSPQIYAGDSRPAATCEKVSYQVDFYNIENQADEDLFNQLKTSGLSYEGQDTTLSPEPWRFETLQNLSLCTEKVTPAAPEVTQAVCSGPGESTTPTITLPETAPKISYTLEDTSGAVVPSSDELGFGDYVVVASLNGSTTPKLVLTSPLPAGWTLAANEIDARYHVTLTDPGDCNGESTPPEPKWVDECGPDNGHWDYTDTETYTYSETTNEDGSITVTVAPNKGYKFPEGTVTEWTKTDSEEDCIIDAPPPPVWTDNCDVAGSWDVPADGDNYHFEISAVLGGAQTVTLVADDGYAFPEGTVTGWSETEDAGDCALLPGDIGAECVSAVPYLAYAVDLPAGFVSEEQPQARRARALGANPVTITFVNPDGADYVVKDQPLSGRILWPGASDVEPLQWPGWTQDADGNYVETDGNYAWTREGVTVRFEVNPTFETTVGYPPATSKCANPPKKEGGPPPKNPPESPPSTPPVVYHPPTTTTTTTTTTGLPNTGGTSLMEGVLGALMVLAGAVMLASRRKARG